MYERAALLFLYADSPLHPGAGVSFGAVDLVVQRERATEYPMVQGSGLKGALRHHFEVKLGPQGTEFVRTVFGAGVDEGDRAGAAAFSDARLVVFPVRSLAGTFAYTTSAYALARLKRDLATAGVPVGWEVPEPPRDTVIGAGKELAVDGRVVLEELDYKLEESEEARRIGQWLGENALADDPHLSFFKKRLATHFLVLHDDDFRHFVRFATQIEPHVRIDPETGTAQDGGFFYSENLPPDSILYSLVGLARPRKPKNGQTASSNGESGPPSTAVEVGRQLKVALHEDRVIQVGADETTGRGLLHVRFVFEEGKNNG